MKMIVFFIFHNRMLQCYEHIRCLDSILVWCYFFYPLEPISWAIFQFHFCEKTFSCSYFFFLVLSKCESFFLIPFFFFRIQHRNAMPNKNKRRRSEEKTQSKSVPFHNSFGTNCYSQFASCNIMCALHFPLPTSKRRYFCIGNGKSKKKNLDSGEMEKILYNSRLAVYFYFFFVGGI